MCLDMILKILAKPKSSNTNSTCSNCGSTLRNSNLNQSKSMEYTYGNYSNIQSNKSTNEAHFNFPQHVDHYINRDYLRYRHHPSSHHSLRSFQRQTISIPNVNPFL